MDIWTKIDKWFEKRKIRARRSKIRRLRKEISSRTKKNEWIPTECNHMFSSKTGGQYSNPTTEVMLFNPKLNQYKTKSYTGHWDIDKLLKRGK